MQSNKLQLPSRTNVKRYKKQHVGVQNGHKICLSLIDIVINRTVVVTLQNGSS